MSLTTASTSKTSIRNDQWLGAVRQQIVGIDAKVPLLNGTKTTYINFDNAASTPVLVAVLKTLNDFMPWYSSVHRGSGYKSLVSTEAYERARQIVGQAFGANANEHIVIFGKNSTEALNKLSYRLPLAKSDIVLVSLLEHHSNDLPWRRQATVKRIKVDRLGRLDENDYYRLLKKYHGRVKLVAVTGASNVTGYVPDIYRLAAMAHKAGAQILVDSAQLAPHRPINIGRLNQPQHLDYIVVSAHKLYAPFGTGALIGRRDTFETGEPEQCGGGTIDLVTTNRVQWTNLPDRDEAGSPNVVGAVTMAAALEQLGKIGWSKIAEHESELTAYALTKLAAIKGVRLFGDDDSENNQNRLGVIPLEVKGLHHALVAAVLGSEWGIGVRNGCFCAHPYVTKLLGMQRGDIELFGDEVMRGDKSRMPGMVRISLGIYNTAAEVDKLAEALTAIAAGDIAGQYRQDKATGDYQAVGWSPPKPAIV
ncbi:aminotransferase class V-fold PLP-dependent enzyme [Candidatus Saccharibacteria bacterium]|nr:aminotransferase class V-fold PLP-dependent enzyme [Candidatus Saccharibacteria bacterium]